MKGHVKRAIDTLEALGFTRTDDTRYGRSVYTHPYDPDCPLKVWAHMSEAAAIALQRKANAIARTGHQGPTMPKSIGERHRLQRQQQKARLDREARERAARRHHAPQVPSSAEQAAKRRELIEGERHRRDIEDLMRPGYGR